ncbi:MAG: glycosyltransferase family 1 protein [Alphaproteobacteria bacterium]|nr:glycosyltransferase family 1 protein [Alphaproteobacteria bacterium]
MAGKTILISINSSWNIVNFRSGLIRALIADGFRVVALAPPEGVWPERIVALGAEFQPIKIDRQGTSPMRDAALLWRYWQALRRIRPDVLLTYTAKPNVYGSLAARIAGVPVINNVAGLGTAFIRDNWLTRVMEKLYRAAFLRSSTVFFQNEDDLEQFVAAGLAPPDRALVLPGSGIDLTRFVPGARPTAERGDARVTFLLVARLLWDKGLAEYVEAARTIRASRPDVRFQILGPLDAGNRTVVSREEVERWSAAGLVEYLGEAEDVRPHLAAADCIVLPSYREGLPKVLLEGAAMGKPLIATDVQGCRSVVEDGINGFLCAPRSSEALAGAMLRFVDLPEVRRAALGAASRCRVEERFDERLVIQRYREAIRRAAGD